MSSRPLPGGPESGKSLEFLWGPAEGDSEEDPGRRVLDLFSTPESPLLPSRTTGGDYHSLSFLLQEVAKESRDFYSLILCLFSLLFPHFLLVSVPPLPTPSTPEWGRRRTGPARKRGVDRRQDIGHICLPQSNDHVSSTAPGVGLWGEGLRVRVLTSVVPLPPGFFLPSGSRNLGPELVLRVVPGELGLLPGTSGGSSRASVEVGRGVRWTGWVGGCT